MFKIRIYIVFEMLVFAKANEVLQVTLCENYGQRNESVTCPENRTISLKSIVYGESRCKDSDNNLVCHSTLNAYFENHCAGLNNCTLPNDILSNNSCQKPSRHLKVTFECYRDHWLAFWRRDKRYTIDTCSKTLLKVKCPSKYHMHIKYVESFRGETDCHNKDTSCAKGILNGLCNDKQKCLPDTTKTSCLVHERFASIYFVCKGQMDPLVTETLTSSSSVETTTIDAASATTKTSDDNLPVFRTDFDHRVEIYYPSRNLTLSLCSVGWDDFAAEVLCKSLNRTWIGNASSVDKLLDIQTLPYSLHCSGLESSLSACNFTEDDNGCNTTTVAGATCCQGTGIPGECVLNPSSKKLASVKSGFQTIVAVGVPASIIGMVCIIVAIVLIRRRCTRENSDKKFSNFMSNATDENYLGQQDIALPQYPTNNKVLYSQVQKRDTDTTKNEDGQDCSHPSKDIESPYALSEEGVYDKTDDRRHIVNDTDMYSRTVDTVYDSAEQHIKEERKEETYDHFFGEKTEDNYDQTTKT
ncbi:uncharacterized protein LOC134721653 isoform X2 [Mytilus trossulus]|uniref:uncharacterized protein LOC134721653 isoform X2 n=1 Tax=Mytilus trossulus TaxID=6551 RepID=UPI0030044274